MEKIIKVYADYLHQLGYAASSINGKHKRNITEFIGFTARYEVREWHQIQGDHISDYLNYLRGRQNKVVGGKLCEKTIYDHYRSLQLLYDLLTAKGHIAINPTSEISIKAPVSNPRRTFLTEPEISQLYAVCQSYKERAILSLNYGCGLRVNELEQLEIRDIQLDDQYLVVRKGKGNKRRVVPMSIGVVKDLRNYLKIERPRLTMGRLHHLNNQALMLNELGSTMREWTYNKTLRRLARRTENQGLIRKHISTHILRHSIATHLLHRGLDIHQLRHFLGHVLLSTTQIYTHVNNKQVLQI